MATKKRRMRKTKRIRGGTKRRREGTSSVETPSSRNQEPIPSSRNQEHVPSSRNQEPMYYPVGSYRVKYKPRYNTGHVLLKGKLAEMNMKGAVSKFLGYKKPEFLRSLHNHEEGEESHAESVIPRRVSENILLQEQIDKENEELAELTLSQKEIEGSIAKYREEIKQLEQIIHGRSFFGRIAHHASKSIQRMSGIETEEQRLRTELDELDKLLTRQLNNDKRIKNKEEYIVLLSTGLI